MPVSTRNSYERDRSPVRNGMKEIEVLWEWLWKR